MSAEEKILQSITDDARVQADKIIREAELRAEKITEDAKASAKEYSAGVVSAALMKAQAIKKNAESAAELTVRDARLAKKHEEMSKTMDMALNKIVSLPDKEYFGLLAGLAKQNIFREGGVILLGAADLKRDLSVFDKLLSENGIKLQIEKVAANIENGFILKWGDVEYNFSLDAVIADKKNLLEDRMHRVLFAE